MCCWRFRPQSDPSSPSVPAETRLTPQARGQEQREEWGRHGGQGGPRSPGQQVPQKQNHLKHPWGQLRPLSAQEASAVEMPPLASRAAACGWRCSSLPVLRGLRGLRQAGGGNAQAELLPLGSAPSSVLSACFSEWRRREARLPGGEARPAAGSGAGWQCGRGGGRAAAARPGVSQSPPPLW